MPEKLPKGWVKTTLGEIRLDASIGISQQQMRGETFELYSVPSFGTRNPELVPGDTIGSNKILVTHGDVLLCKINPRINRAWIVDKPKNHRQIASTEWIVFSRHEGVLPEFLLYFFIQDRFRDYLAANVSGVGGSLMRVNARVVETYPILLPPIHEQARIVAKLETQLSRLVAGEAAAQRAQVRLHRYRSAVIDAAVTGALTLDWRGAQQKKEKTNSEDGNALLRRILTSRRSRWEESQLQHFRAKGNLPTKDNWKSRYDEPTPPSVAPLASLPSDWTWSRLEQLGFIIGGLTKNPRRMGLRLKLPYLRVANVYANELRLDNVASIGVENRELDKLLLKKDDLLIVEGNGSKDQIGRIAIWDGSIKKCVHQNHVIKVRLVEKALASWIAAWLLSPSGRKHIEQVASSTTGLYTLSICKVGNLPIPLPPVAEQAEVLRQMERRILAADRLVTTLGCQLIRARATRQLLLREAFTGRLVPQDTTNEPASALLERIHEFRNSYSFKPNGKPMKTSTSKMKFTRRPLLDVLRENKKPMTPEMLFTVSGYNQDFTDEECRQEIVDAFYDELRQLVGPKGPVIEKRPNSKSVLLEIKS